MNAVKNSHEMQVKRDIRDVCMPMGLVYEALVKASRLIGGQGKEEEEMDQEKGFCQYHGSLNGSRERWTRQDQAPPAPPQPQAPIVEQQPMQPGQYLPMSLYEFRRNKPPVFSGIEHDTDPQDFVDICDRLCTALGCSPVRTVELTSY